MLRLFESVQEIVFTVYQSIPIKYVAQLFTKCNFVGQTFFFGCCCCQKMMRCVITLVQSLCAQLRRNMWYNFTDGNHEKLKTLTATPLLYIIYKKKKKNEQKYLLKLVNELSRVQYKTTYFQVKPHYSATFRIKKVLSDDTKKNKKITTR